MPTELEEIEYTIWKTEKSLFGGVKAQRSQVAMWLDLDKRNSFQNSSIELIPVRTERDWALLEELRVQIEIPFDITDRQKISAILQEMRKIDRIYRGQWYLAICKNRPVGSIGLFEFESVIGTVGRLLDVDILPSFKGQGLGTQMMSALISEAGLRKLKGLCLKTDEDGRARTCYERLGFIPVGVWYPAPLQPAIETSRMSLEPITEAHTQELTALFSDPLLHQFVDYKIPSYEEVQKRCRRWEKRISRDGTELWLNWMAREKEGRRALGHFQAGISKQSPEVATIGYIVQRSSQRQGFAAEGLSAIFDYLRTTLQVQEVRAWIHWQNEASIALVQKLGLSQIAVEKDVDGIAGNDDIIFSRRWEE